MKIVAISDTHKKCPELPSADLLIHCGDWSGSGTQTDTLFFLEWMKKNNSKYGRIVCIPGNHERYIEAHQEEV